MNIICVRTSSGADLYLNLSLVCYYVYDEQSNCTKIKLIDGSVEVVGNITKTLNKYIIARGGTIGDARPT